MLALELSTQLERKGGHRGDERPAESWRDGARLEEEEEDDKEEEERVGGGLFKVERDPEPFYSFFLCPSTGRKQRVVFFFSANT